MPTKTPTFKSLTKHLDWVDPDIEKHFTLDPIRSSEYKLYHFDRYISSKDALKEMENGYAPATLHELLAWKGWNEKDFVVALGSVCEVDCDRCVPHLDRGIYSRHLGLGWFDGGWRGGARFLAVRLYDAPKLGPSPSESSALESAIAIVKKAGYQVSKII